MDPLTEEHPRDRWITVYGRKPVSEALDNDRLEVTRLLVSHTARGAVVDRILASAHRRSLKVERVTPKQVNRLSRNARQDQGVAADVEAPRMTTLETWLKDAPARASVLALDGVTTPGNVGLILRSAVAAGLDGVLVPRKGAAPIGPLVIKASAGLAFQAPILRCAAPGPALELLGEAGFVVFGLGGEGTESLFDLARPERAVYVLGSESEGLSPESRAHVDRWLRVPMAPGVESLNVACAGTLVAYAATWMKG